MAVMRGGPSERLRGPRWGDAVRHRLRWRHRWGAGWEPVVESLLTPPVDMYETGESVVVRVDLPGVKREHLEVSVEGGDMLTIRGERAADDSKDIQYVCCERAAGRVEREIGLPVAVDAGSVKAALRDGVLEIVLPKSGAVIPHEVAVAVE